MEAKEVGRRFKELRRYLDYDSGPQFAKRIGVSKQTISSIETNGDGLTRERIQFLCDEFKIDSRYFFGQIDSTEEADLSKRGIDPKQSQIERLTAQIKEMGEQLKFVRPRSDLSPEAERVMQNNELTELVRQVMFWDGNALRTFRAMAFAYMEGKNAVPADSDTERVPISERTGSGQ